MTTSKWSSWCSFSGTSPQNQSFDWNVGNETSQTTWACAEKTPVTPSTPSHLCFLFSFTKKPHAIEESADPEKIGPLKTWNWLGTSWRLMMMEYQISIDAARAYKPPFNWSQILVWSNSFWTLLCVNELCVKRLCVMRQARNQITICHTPLQNDTCT